MYCLDHFLLWNVYDQTQFLLIYFLLLQIERYMLLNIPKHQLSVITALTGGSALQV